MRIAWWLMLLPSLTLLACRDTGRAQDAKRVPAAGTRSERPAERVASLGYVSGSQGPAAGSAKQGALDAMWAGQKLVRTCSLEIEVADLARASVAVRRAAESHGGMVSDSKVSRGEAGSSSANLTLLIPTERLEGALDDLRKLGKVQDEKINTADITKEYEDLETRLTVKRQTEQRLREILTSRTGKLSEVLEVERELDRIVGEIERMEGEKRYYDRQVSVSKVSLNLYEPHAGVRPGHFSEVAAAFKEAVHGLSLSLAGLVYLVTYLLPWLVLVVVIWSIARAVRKRRRGKTVG